CCSLLPARACFCCRLLCFAVVRVCRCSFSFASPLLSNINLLHFTSRHRSICNAFPAGGQGEGCLSCQQVCNMLRSRPHCARCTEPKPKCWVNYQHTKLFRVMRSHAQVA
ncbi:unnamed protein product, partial [Pylaiella littoralis]